MSENALSRDKLQLVNIFNLLFDKDRLVFDPTDPTQRMHLKVLLQQYGNKILTQGVFGGLQLHARQHPNDAEKVQATVAFLKKTIPESLDFRQRRDGGRHQAQVLTNSIRAKLTGFNGEEHLGTFSIKMTLVLLATLTAGLAAIAVFSPQETSSKTDWSNMEAITDVVDVSTHEFAAALASSPTNTLEPTATDTPQPTATSTPQPTATNTLQPTATDTLEQRFSQGQRSEDSIVSVDPPNQNLDGGVMTEGDTASGNTSTTSVSSFTEGLGESHGDGAVDSLKATGGDRAIPPEITDFNRTPLADDEVHVSPHQGTLLLEDQSPPYVREPTVLEQAQSAYPDIPIAMLGTNNPMQFLLYDRDGRLVPVTYRNLAGQMLWFG